MRQYKFDKQFTKYVLKKYNGDVQLVAEEIGCSPETVRRACRKYKIPLKRGRRKRAHKVSAVWSVFGDWLAEHEDEISPITSVPKVRNLSGFTYKTVYMYFYNRRKEAKRVCMERPWARGDKSVTLENKDGERLPIGAATRVQAYVEKPSGIIKLIVTTHTGQEYTFRYAPKKLAKLFEE